MNITKESTQWDEYLAQLEEVQVTCNIDKPEECDSCGS